MSKKTRNRRWGKRKIRRLLYDTIRKQYPNNDPLEWMILYDFMWVRYRDFFNRCERGVRPKTKGVNRV